MLNCQDDLWRVPGHLLSQLRRQNEIEAYRRGHKENATAVRLLIFCRILIGNLFFIFILYLDAKTIGPAIERAHHSENYQRG